MTFTLTAVGASADRWLDIAQPGPARRRGIAVVTLRRIGNSSGFFGDRVSAAAELVDGRRARLLTGDWLAELTMAILHRQRARDPATGWASTFLRQLEDVLGTCLDRGSESSSNAGGLNPAGCAEAVERLAERLGLSTVGTSTATT